MIFSYCSPIETLTFLTTDIEGSTGLLTRLGAEVYATALSDHHAIIREALEAHGGREEGTQGDSFFATFTSPSAGVAAVIQAQRTLGTHEWPRGEQLRVRMGMHSGEAADAATGLVGYEVHRAARIGAVAHGGQVLLSSAAAGLVEDSLPQDAALRDLGTHRLKDLGRPETLFQLEAPGLRDHFPPLRSLDNPELPNNLPASLSLFVGRIGELAEVVELLHGSRLVTLTGSGGAGKTRLALQAAAEVLDGNGEGVWFVELASVSDPGQVATAIAEALEMRVESDRPPTEVLLSALKDQSILVVLDNCEHLVDSVAKLADLIGRGCPKVSLLATSREPLGVDGERVYRVRSLSLPAEDVDEIADLEGSDAVQLFVTRAVGHDSTFSIDDENASLAASVCRRLDGIPLAIELAAARLSSMSLGDLSRRLDQRFRLLTGGSRSALPRQQTLGAMVAWSYDLLAVPEREVLRRLTVFVDGFDLDAAEAVCATESVAAFDVVDLVGSLVNKSLVVGERAHGTLRYSLLETIRQYAAEQLLQEDGEEAAMELRKLHAEHFLGLCEQGASSVRGGDDQVEWLFRFDLEWGNLQGALTHFASESDGAEAIVRLVWSLGAWYITRGHRQPLAVLQEVLDQTRDAALDVRCRALLAWSLGAGVYGSDDPATLESVVGASEEARALAVQLGDRSLELLGLNVLGFALCELDRKDDALPLAHECLGIADELGDPHLLGRTHCLLGVAQWTSDNPTQLAIRREALAWFRRADDRIWECTLTMLVALNGWGTLEDVAESVPMLEEAERLAHEIESPAWLAYIWGNLALAHAILDDHAVAEQYCRRNLRAIRRVGLTQGFMTFDTLVMSHCAAGRGDAALASQLAGASEAFWHSVPRPADFRWTPMELDLIERNKSHLVTTLGQAEFKRLFAAGQRLSIERATDLALGRGQGTGSSGRSTSQAASAN